MQKVTKNFALLLACAMMLVAVGCSTGAPAPATQEPAAAAEPVAAAEPAAAEPAAAEPAGDTPLVVAYSPFSQKFSPYYADTAYDQDVVSLVSLSMMTTDRMGGIIYNAIEGETVPYNGTDYLYKGPADLSVEYDAASDTTTYTAKIRDDLKFWFYIKDWGKRKRLRDNS